MPPNHPSPDAPSAAPNIIPIADRLHSTAIHLLRRLRRVDERTGLGAPALSALSVLVFGGPKTSGELAAIEQVRPPSMTRVIRDLTRRGLVRAARDPDDRRVTRLSATPAGVRLMRQGRGQRVQLLADWLVLLPGDKLTTIDDAARALADLLANPDARIVTADRPVDKKRRTSRRAVHSTSPKR